MDGDTYSVYAIFDGAEEAIETFMDYDEAYDAFVRMRDEYPDCDVYFYDAVLGTMIDQWQARES